VAKIYDFPMKGPPPPTAVLFRRTLRSLYGEHWKERGALALDLNLRTVRRMADGQRPIPRDIWETLHRLLLEKTNLALLTRRLPDAPP
jgi:hypothetical protein